MLKWPYHAKISKFAILLSLSSPGEDVEWRETSKLIKLEPPLLPPLLKLILTTQYSVPSTQLRRMTTYHLFRSNTYLPYWVLKAPLWGNRSAHQAATDTPSQRGTRNTEQNFMGRVRFLGVGGNRSARRKPTKAGMESANQIHIQPLASCIGERKVYEH